MNRGVILSVFFMILNTFLLGVMAFAEEEDLEKSFNDTETQIRNKLFEYDQEKHTSSLQDVYEILRVVDYHFGKKGWENRAHRFAELRLQLLNTCFNERDYSYDLDNPPVFCTMVAPPLWALEYQPNLIAGMRPEDVIDPEARKQYVEAIAENKLKKEKDLRERGLQNIIDREISNVARYMAAIQEDPERWQQMLISLDALIESEVLKKKIMDAFEERVAKRNARKEAVEKHKDTAHLR